MQKNEFIEKLANSLDCSREQAETYFNAVIKGFKDLLMKGDEFTIPGFGKFLVQRRAARTGRNPLNGQPLEIDAKAVPAFKPGDALKLHVNNALRTD